MPPTSELKYRLIKKLDDVDEDLSIAEKRIEKHKYLEAKKHMRACRSSLVYVRHTMTSLSMLDQVEVRKHYIASLFHYRKVDNRLSSLK